MRSETRRRLSSAAALGGAAVGVALLSLTPSAAPAQSDAYQECLEIAQQNPTAGREHAARWEAIGGGSEARHCAAISLIGLGLVETAAEILTKLGAEARDLNADDRSGSLLLAGDLWLQVDQPTLAFASFERVIELRGSDPARFRAARIGMSRAAAALGEWNEAIQNLDRLLEQQPGLVDALSLRAAAHRAKGDFDRALTDAVRATEIEPEAAIAWFERGAAERSLGRLEAAQESWVQASLLDFEGPVGEMAQINLQLMAADDAGAEE